MEDPAVEIIDKHEHHDGATTEWRIECLEQKFLIVVLSVVEAPPPTAQLAQALTRQAPAKPTVIELAVVSSVVCDNCNSDHKIDQIGGFPPDMPHEELFERYVRLLKWRLGVPTKPVEAPKIKH